MLKYMQWMGMLCCTLQLLQPSHTYYFFCEGPYYLLAPKCKCAVAHGRTVHNPSAPRTWTQRLPGNSSLTAPITSTMVIQKDAVVSTALHYLFKLHVMARNDSLHRPLDSLTYYFFVKDRTTFLQPISGYTY
jgi:hypothetical protein